MPARVVDPQSVFLNVPFGPNYERFFISLIASLVSVGRKPHCALEISGLGRPRLDRIFRLMASCRVSIHDLSAVGMPARFNMPFELGIACGLARFRKPHDFILLERQRNRLDKTLSDIKGWDPLIYRGSSRALESCILGSLTSRRGNPDPREVQRVSKALWRVAREEKSARNTDDFFNAAVFKTLVGAAGILATREGLIGA